LIGLSLNISEALQDRNLDEKTAQKLLDTYQLNESDVFRATGKDLKSNFKARDEADAKAAAATKAAADKIAADVKADKDKATAFDKAAADKAAADKLAADKAAADAKAKADADAKALADAAAKAARDKALADAAAKAARDKALADAAAKAAADKAAADAAVKANTITTGGTYTGTTGTTPPIGTTVGQGKITGTGTEASTGTTGPIVDFGNTPGFTTSPLKLAQQQIAEKAAADAAAQNLQLGLYSSWITANPNATDLEHVNFLDKLALPAEIAAKATTLSPQQMQNRYYDAKYNKMTGDSQAAYNYLMGKGANPTKSGVGEIMRPYSEATLGMPVSSNKQFIYDPATRGYSVNPNYVSTYRDEKGAVNYTMSPTEIAAYFKANQGQDDSATYDWAIDNGLTAEDISAATGVPLATVAAKWRDAKAKKAAAAKTETDKATTTDTTEKVGRVKYRRECHRRLNETGHGRYANDWLRRGRRSGYIRWLL
jgi:hypothetical protein